MQETFNLSAECKLEQFNGCPGKEFFLKCFDLLLRDNQLHQRDIVINFFDRPSILGWTNDDATAVFYIPERNALEPDKLQNISLETLVIFSQALADLQPNEYEVQWLDDTIKGAAFRFWWD